MILNFFFSGSPYLPDLRILLLLDSLWPKIQLLVRFTLLFAVNMTSQRCLSPPPQLASNDTNGLLITISSGFWHSSGVNDRHATSPKLGAEPLVSYVTGLRSGRWEPISATFPFSICCLNKQWPLRCLLCLCSECLLPREKKPEYFQSCWGKILSQTQQEVLFVFYRRKPATIVKENYFLDEGSKIAHTEKKIEWK